MKILPRFLYFLAFTGMAASAALALDGALQPSLATGLLRAVVAASLCGAAGLVHRKAWPVSLLLLPVGAYLLLRTTMPAAAGVEGVGGVYQFYVEHLAAGASEYTRQHFPIALQANPELQLLLAFTVYCLTGIAAFLALSLRRPVPGIALVLLLLGFSVTVDTLPRVVGIAILFLVLAACLLVLSRSLDRRSWRFRDAVAGVAVGVVGSLLAIAVLAAAPSAAAAPWQDWRTWNPFNQGSYFYSFNWLQNYPRLLDPANNVVIMKVQSGRPSYWRANALDSFTGEAWISSQGYTEDVERVPGAAGFVYSVPQAEPPQTGEVVTESFRVHDVYTNYLFTGGDPRSLTLRQDVVLRTNDMRSLHVTNALGPSLDYSLEAIIPTITPRSLVGLGSDYPQDFARYLELPFYRAGQLEGTDKETAWHELLQEKAPNGWQWADLYSLNRAVVGQATDPYEITLRLERYLRQSYTYTLEPPASDYPSPYAAFLFDTRAGYCQHFAGTMAMLLRFNDIPARVAVGFTAGELERPGVYTVATGNAHAWVEAYFPTVGWVAFDPTPGRNLPNAGASSTSPGFRDPFATSTSGQTTPTTEDRPDPRSGPPERPETDGNSGSGWLTAVPWLPWLLGLLVLLAAWPFGRRLWRERGLRRGPLEQRFATSLDLLRGSLSGYGLGPMGSRTTEEVLEIVDAQLDTRSDPVMETRAGAILFGGRAATDQDLERAEAFRRKVETGLRKRHGRFRAVLAWYGIPHSRPHPARGQQCFL